MNLVQADKTAYAVSIRLAVRSASTAVRFPCLFSVQWRTNNQKTSVETARYSPQGGKTDFNEDLLLKTEVAFDKVALRFLKKETQVQLNLISKSRPDQSKLVGRVTIDLASILNDGLYADYTELPLQFCSVNATLLMAFQVVQQVECELSLSQLELSMGESVALTSAIRLASATSSMRDRSQDQSQISMEAATVSNLRNDPQKSLKKETTQQPSALLTESRTSPQPPPKIETPRTQANQTPEQKPVTRSFKSIAQVKESILTRKSESADTSQQMQPRDESKKSSFKKMGSINSEDGRISEDISKQKLETDRMKMEADRYKQEAELYRLQLEKAKQQCELAKVELKQRKTNVDHSASQIATIRSELARTRQELSKSREQSVSLTLKLAELRESHNRSLLQATVSEQKLTKLQGANQKLQSLFNQRDQLQGQVSTLQSEIADYQSRYEQLQLQKASLQTTLNNLDKVHQEALSKCTEHEQNLTEHKGSYQSEMRALREQLKIETKDRMQKQLLNNNLNEEIERLISVAAEFQEARHSWSITENINKEEGERRQTRVRELQENLISIDQRVRWLEGQNELLTENARKNRQQFLKIKSEKEIQSDASAEEIKRYQQAIQEARQEKHHLQSELSAMQDLVCRLQQQCDDLKSGNDFQVESLTQLEVSLSEVTHKNHQLQELVLNINELRDKQRQDASEKEIGYLVKVAQLEGSNRQLQELVQANSERVAVVEEELKSREGLIIRLQEGLRTQVERSEQLNNRVMYFMEKQQRMKETLLLLQLQSRKVMDLLAEQEAREVSTQQLVQQLQSKNGELMANLQESLQYTKGLEQLAKSNESTALAKINSLTKELQKKMAQLAQNKLTIESKNGKIKEVQEQYGQLQLQAKQASRRNQKAIDELKNQVEFLQSSIQAVEAALAQKSTKLQQAEGELSSKHSQLDDRIASIDKQTAEFQRLCGQLKEIQLNHQREIQQSEQRYLQTISKYQQLEHAYSIKEAKYGADVQQLQQQIKELKENLQAVSKDNTTQAVAGLKKEIREKNDWIKQLENELKSANFEANKVPNLERSLKIKSIELNSLKFKGKNDGSEGSQLIRLKDEEISALTAQRQRLLQNQSELQELREKSEALATQLELIEQQKFNIQSLSNERALQLEEARDQNRKLMDQITIIGERNGQLQKTIQDLLSSEQTKPGAKGDAALKAQITLLKGQLKELQQARQKVHQLEESRKKIQQQMQRKEQEHMIALIDQQFHLAKSNSQIANNTELKKSMTITNQDAKQIPNLAITYKSLQETIEERLKNKSNQKMVQLIQSLLSQKGLKNGTIMESLRGLSKEFQKIKVQVMKFDGKTGPQRVKLMNLFKGYESVLADAVRQGEGVSN